MHVTHKRGAFVAKLRQAQRKIREQTSRFAAVGDAINAHVDYGRAGPNPPGVTMAVRPREATTMSAWRTTAARSRVFEWQIVTVAFACISSRAMGFPTMSLRPSTTACAPSMAMPLRRRISITPEGVHATRPAGR